MKTRKELNDFVRENITQINQDEMYFKQYKSAEAIYEALEDACLFGSHTADTDQLIITVGAKAYSLPLFNAEAISAVTSMLLEIENNAVDQFEWADHADLQELIPIYNHEEDMTFIMLNTYIRRKGCVDCYSRECVGWYCGEPNDADTHKFANRELKAVYDDVSEQ